MRPYFIYRLNGKLVVVPSRKSPGIIEQQINDVILIKDVLQVMLRIAANLQGLESRLLDSIRVVSFSAHSSYRPNHYRS